MKQYTVIDKQTGAQVAGPFEELQIAVRVQKAFGPAYGCATWVAHFGLPALACVMRELDGEIDRLETICLYKAEAVRIAKQKNAQEPGKFIVRTVLLNTAYPRGEEFVGTEMEE
ncbi:MAG TPA: hypothetical protein VIG24_12860 [Acidimicrobiia bacterium]